METLRVYKMRADAVVPRYKTSGAAGLDLAACLDTPLTLEPGGTARVPTGLRIALPAGHEGQVRPRSGLAARHRVTVLNAPGTIDEDYRGELQVLLVNHGSEAFTIESGDRIAQLIVAPVTQVNIEIVDDSAALGGTERAEGGFGSTGR
ncbi:MAG: dUTP diphosphatase [Deltaproteobacteria bacterium]|jgi:dUTP pyrophosphatase|nr:dUTP diphosphatase [Deltaproteobacteria bacterium]